MKKFMVVFAFLSPLSAHAQTIDFAVEAVQYFADVKVEIVDYFADRKVCITNANELEEVLLRSLNLID